MQATANGSPASRHVLFVLAFAAAALLVLAATSPPAAARHHAGSAATKFLIGHMACYPAKLGGGQKPKVTLKNQFGKWTALTGPTLSLCAPAKKNTSPRLNPAAHLTCYRLDQVHGTTGTKRVEVTNQFDTFEMTAVLSPPVSLCLPSSKTLSTSTAAPGPVPPTIDHYVCYTIDPGGPFKVPDTAKVSDQFGAGKDKVLKPHMLCVPTSKNNGHILSPATHLLCYDVESTVKGLKVVVRNQFGLWRGALGMRNSLCLPSTKKVIE